jgi:hypothetical protein
LEKLEWFMKWGIIGQISASLSLGDNIHLI